MKLLDTHVELPTGKGLKITLELTEYEVALINGYRRTSTTLVEVGQLICSAAREAGLDRNIRNAANLTGNYDWWN